ncbi:MULTISPECIES: hypothetical protein [Paenarthrobacter]|jgi:hypothetical protein|uniref:Uncharacterized protein n=1 Tax=Paenarthrobacter nicotinovorans TaxID=29320 RepID=A0ABT9TQL5_PAENI|nr:MULTISPECIES: hypothetical protein [Paenarthrobacter]SKC04874.1 hypothetical protein SAMN05660916_04109 [Arthrobacter sp. 31Cvi3.1E]BCW09163.1 hypothetical protein NtRootA2_04450 [Arthrobacter sp. NtRootA2]BCW13243.1 hypothetical protein NtRootA4_02220 [Arthrobacter sp. NtRootA4]BCW21579.1 hypothetical protein NtRootC7_04460 [Arthrobacter sp. NtRootC7]BCW25846.1 hypothetical protein NtRootC45_04460 [Arthrobacter sp. NtRootC45]BCW30116.1 hypothetical protein NtRootD5_04470 [Arthrobacter sp.
MSYISTTDGTLRLSHQANDVTLTLDASKPMTLRIEVDRCPCGSEHSRPGSYVDSDLNN